MKRNTSARKTKLRRVNSRNRAKTLHITGVPSALILHYQERALAENVSVSEYLLIKLAADFAIERRWNRAVKPLKRGLDDLLESDEIPKEFFSSPGKYSNSPKKSSITHIGGTRSGYRGVYRYGKRWEAAIRLDGERQRIGVYDTPHEAAQAYDNALVLRTGSPDSAVNFPSRRDTQLEQSLPFLDKLAAGGTLTKAELDAWQHSSDDVTGPATHPGEPGGEILSVMVGIEKAGDGPLVEASDRAPLFRRSEARLESPAVPTDPDSKD